MEAHPFPFLPFFFRSDFRGVPDRNPSEPSEPVSSLSEPLKEPACFPLGDPKAPAFLDVAGEGKSFACLAPRQHVSKIIDVTKYGSMLATFS